VHPSLNAKVTVAEWLEEWRASHSLHKRPTTLARDVSAIRRHLVPRLGDIQLAKPRRTDVQGFVADLCREVGPGTSRSIYGVLRAALDAGVNAELRARSPARGIKLAPNTQDRRGHLPPPRAPQPGGGAAGPLGAHGVRRRCLGSALFRGRRPTRGMSRSRARQIAGDRNRAPGGRRPRRTQDRRRAPHRPAAWSDRPGARRASPPAPPHRRRRFPTRPLQQSRTGRRHLWCRTYHPGHPARPAPSSSATRPTSQRGLRSPASPTTPGTHPCGRRTATTRPVPGEPATLTPCGSSPADGSASSGRAGTPTPPTTQHGTAENNSPPTRLDQENSSATSPASSTTTSKPSRPPAIHDHRSPLGPKRRISSGRCGPWPASTRSRLCSNSCCWNCPAARTTSHELSYPTSGRSRAGAPVRQSSPMAARKRWSW
jgi:Phage integrase, N-terminal SAM-like domain